MALTIIMALVKSTNLSFSLCKMGVKCLFSLYFLVYLFILRKGENASGGERERGREREGERVPSRFCTVSAELPAGLEPTNCEIMTWVETKSQMLNQLSHPSAPKVLILKHDCQCLVAQLVKHLTLILAQVMISQLMSSSPALGSVLTVWIPLGILTLFAPLPLTPAHSLAPFLSK